MGMGREFVEENAFEMHNSGNRYAEILEELSESTDYELLTNCIKEGEELDNFKPFPAYSIAQKILYNKWRLTKKQREAMLNCLAYHLAEAEDND